MATIQQYFQNGTLPEANTVCDVIGELFPIPGSQDKFLQGLSPEDRQRVEAATTISRAFRKPFPL